MTDLLLRFTLVTENIEYTFYYCDLAEAYKRTENKINWLEKKRNEKKYREKEKKHILKNKKIYIDVLYYGSRK